MKKEYEDTLLILRSYKSNSNIDFSKCDVNQVLKIAAEHSVIGIVASILLKNNIGSTEFRKKCESFQWSVFQRHFQQEEDFKTLSTLFDQEGIDYIPFKGICICNTYPIPELRQMGDIDIIIREKDLDRVRNVLKQNNCWHLHESDKVDSLQTEYSEFEIHRFLFPLLESHLPLSGRDFLSENIWIKAKGKKGSFQYHFSIDDEFIYMILHIASHFYYQSCGIRFFLDLDAYIRCYGKEMNWTYIHDECVRASYEELLYSCLYISHKWFNTELPWNVPKLSTSQMHILEEFIWQNGTFGHGVKNEPYSMIYRIKKVKFASNSNNININLIRNLFLPDKSWCKKFYPGLVGKPYSYPFVIVMRFIKTLKKYGLKSLADYMSNMRHDIYRGNKFINVLQEIGIHL